MALHVTEHSVQVWNQRDNCFRPMRVRVTVDTQAIADALAKKAFRNKSNVAKEVGGAVIVSL